MALVNCPECSKNGVSDKAQACPGCGYNVAGYYFKKRSNNCEKCNSKMVAVFSGSGKYSSLVHYKCEKCGYMYKHSNI